MGKMFAVIFVCGNLFCGLLEKSQKLEPAKILCHTVKYVKRIVLVALFNVIILFT